MGSPPTLHPTVAALNLEAMMREALAEAEKAGRNGERPIGAVLVVSGVIVSRSHARAYPFKNQILHAEVRALLDGGDPLWERYREAVLVTTMEPCPLCLGAAVMADVPHIVFASHDEVAGAASRQIVETVPYVRRHITTYLGGVLEAEARVYPSALAGYEKPHTGFLGQVLGDFPWPAPIWVVGDSVDADCLPAVAHGCRAILVRTPDEHFQPRVAGLSQAV